MGPSPGLVAAWVRLVHGDACRDNTVCVVRFGLCMRMLLAFLFTVVTLFVDHV